MHLKHYPCDGCGVGYLQAHKEGCYILALPADHELKLPDASIPPEHPARAARTRHVL